MPVYDLEFNPVENKLVAATFSRGLMTFPLEELDLVSANDNMVQSQNILLYPTLVADHFILEYNDNRNFTNKACKVSIAGANGVIFQTTQSEFSDMQTMQINLNEKILPGVYFVLIDTENRVSVKKILVSD